MADDTKTLEEGLREQYAPTGPAVADRETTDGKIHIGATDVNEADVEVVEGPGGTPEVYVSNLERRHPDPSVGVVIPEEALGSLDLPIHAFVRGNHVEDSLSTAAEDEPERPSQSDAGDPPARDSEN